MIDYKQKLLEFKALSEEDRFSFLVRYWKLEDCVSQGNTIKLVGKYQKADKLDKRGKEYGFFVDIRNTKSLYVFSCQTTTSNGEELILSQCCTCW